MLPESWRGKQRATVREGHPEVDNSSYYQIVVDYGELLKALTAEIMGINEYRLRRILAAYRREEAAVPVYGHRACQLRTTIPEAVASAVVVQAREKYAGFSHSHPSEVLAELEGIHPGRQTVSHLLNRQSLPSARRPWSPMHRVRREGKADQNPVTEIRTYNDGCHEKEESNEPVVH